MQHKQKIHFVGIGGAGMSGIAEVLLNLGYQVSGSDLKDSEVTRRLRKLGAKIKLGHQSANLPDGVNVTVVSNAVPDTNPEIRASRERNIPVMPRAQVLNDLMRLKQGIAIAGTHGKSTTTSLVAWILAQAKLDPTMVIGGILNNINQGAHRGRGEYFVVEACEAFKSFLHIFPISVAITNVDDDHLEDYGSRSSLEDAFVEFINRVPFWGIAVLNQDDPGVRQLMPRVIRRKKTYGFDPNADLRAEHLLVSGQSQSFMVVDGSKRLGRLQLLLPGRFNVQNTLAAVALTMELGVSFELIQKAVASFTGVRRRFERKGEYRQALIVDDYAHHPTEIAVTLTAARTLNPNRLLVLFQPHLFSRTQRLYKDFARSLTLADRVYLADIYPARERPIPGVTAQLISEEMELEGKAVSLGPLPITDLLPAIKKELQAGDILITMGAGDVWKAGEELVKAKKRSRKTTTKKAAKTTRSK